MMIPLRAPFLSSEPMNLRNVSIGCNIPVGMTRRSPGAARWKGVGHTDSVREDLDKPSRTHAFMAALETLFSPQKYT
jgi:hypothetical protein